MKRPDCFGNWNPLKYDCERCPQKTIDACCELSEFIHNSAKNIEVRCFKCGTWVKVHARKLKWIRCPTCHNGIEISRSYKRLAKST